MHRSSCNVVLDFYRRDTVIGPGTATEASSIGGSPSRFWLDNARTDGWVAAASALPTFHSDYRSVENNPAPGSPRSSLTINRAADAA